MWGRSSGETLKEGRFAGFLGGFHIVPELGEPAGIGVGSAGIEDGFAVLVQAWEGCGQSDGLGPAVGGHVLFEDGCLGLAGGVGGVHCDLGFSGSDSMNHPGKGRVGVYADIDFGANL